MVRKLGSILRLADGLDRSHTDAVEDLVVEWMGDTMIVWLYPPDRNSAEEWAGQKKSRFFQDVFEVPVRVLSARESRLSY